MPEEDRRQYARRAEDAERTNRIIWWMLGVVTVIMVSLVTAWARHVNSDVDSTKATIVQIDKRLTRIEDKVDRILEEK